jgi:hypothetical protein
MDFFHWAADSWFVLLQSGSIVAGLVFTAVALRDDTRARRVGNLIAITQHHREIWTHLYSRPNLSRVLDSNVDLEKNPVTDEEELFVNLLILHLNSSYQAMKYGNFIKPEGLHQDIRLFFSLPIPSAVWEATKIFQDKDFVEFVETNDKLLGKC